MLDKRVEAPSHQLSRVVSDEHDRHLRHGTRLCAPGAGTTTTVMNSDSSGRRRARQAARAARHRTEPGTGRGPSGSCPPAIRLLAANTLAQTSNREIVLATTKPAAARRA